jgi:hypothetical protein
MKKLLFAGLLGSAALFATGCSDACEKAANTIEDKFEECDIETTGDGDGDSDAECTDEAAEAAEALADCIEKATCDDVKSGAYLTKC